MLTTEVCDVPVVATSDGYTLEAVEQTRFMNDLGWPIMIIKQNPPSGSRDVIEYGLIAVGDRQYLDLVDGGLTFRPYPAYVRFRTKSLESARIQAAKVGYLRCNCGSLFTEYDGDYLICCECGTGAWRSEWVTKAYLQPEV